MTFRPFIRFERKRISRDFRALSDELLAEVGRLEAEIIAGRAGRDFCDPARDALSASSERVEQAIARVREKGR